jgi:hypothetical protein
LQDIGLRRISQRAGGDVVEGQPPSPCPTREAIMDAFRWLLIFVTIASGALVAALAFLRHAVDNVLIFDIEFP